MSTFSDLVLATADLVAYYRLGEPSGTAAVDAVAASDGTYVGSPTLGEPSLVVGETGTAVAFDGSTQHVVLPDALRPTSAFSWVVWVKTSTWNAPGFLMGDIDYSGGMGRFVGCYLRIEADGRPQFSVETPAIEAAGAIAAGAAHMIVGTYDGADARLYVNGALAAGPTAVPTPTAASTFYAGAAYGGNYHWAGTLDDLALFSRALTAGEVAALFVAGSKNVSAAAGAIAITQSFAAVGGKSAIGAATLIASPALSAVGGKGGAGAGTLATASSLSVVGSIECWVTEPDGTYITHLDRSEESPFRRFAFSVERSAAGAGSLEYATPNALLDETPTLFDQGNLVWMRYRGCTVTWVIEQVTRALGGEQIDWVQVSGRGALQLLADRLIWPDGFSEDDLDPSVWSGPGVLTTTLAATAAADQRRIVVVDGDRLREGQKVTVSGGGHSQTSHIRRMRVRESDDRWVLTLGADLAFAYTAGSDVTRHGPAFVATTLTAAVVAGKRHLHVDSAKRLHPGQKVLISSGIVGEHAIVREVEHVRAKSADSTPTETSSASGQRKVVIGGKHFSVGQTVTITGGGHSESHVVSDRVLTDTSPLRHRLVLDGDLAHTYAAGATVSRTSVAESWTVTLRRPLQHGFPIGADVSRPSDQWRTVVGQAAGEMLWDLIDESNARFTTPIAQGTIETDPEDDDQWTQRFRFDTLLDVVEAVTNAYGDVRMDGLTFRYLVDPGTDRSADVIFEEGADIRRVERDRDWREAVTWVVAEGVGEGVRAKLAVSADDTATRRREGYLDAHDATNLPMLEAAADAALAENGPRDVLALDVTEERYAAFTDYDVGDWIRAAAPSRAVDELMRVVAIYVAETDDEQTRVSLDVNSRRTEWLLELDRAQQASKRTLGVNSRQPQGQLVPFTFSGSGVFDEDEAMETFLHLPDRAFLVAEVTANIQLRRFWATARSAAGGGGSTATSGSSSASTTATDGADTRTSSTKASTSPTTTGSLESTDHWHTMFSFMSDTPGGWEADKWIDGNSHYVDLNAATSASLETTTTAVPHHHDVTIGAHSHTVDIPNHTHGMAHTHGVAIPSHTHGLVYGTYAETLPASWAVKVYVDQLDGSSWTNVWTSATVADPDQFVELDLTAVIAEPGSWRIRVRSVAGQPNNGRLACDVWGVVLAGLESS